MKRAFTLIELLVVIAIISILAAILFPVFAQAKSAAKKSVCVSNQKQFLLGFKMYLADSDDNYMPAWTFNPNVLWNQLFLPYIKNQDIFRCPAHSKPGVTSWASPTPPDGIAKPFPLSYIANIHILGNGFNRPTGSAIPVMVNDTAIAQPASTVLLSDGGMRANASAPFVTEKSETKDRAYILADPVVDALFTGCCASLTQVSDVSNPDWAAPAIRHLGKTVVGYTDGHAQATSATRWYFADTPWLDPTRGGQN